jgi:hypothetical protein
MTRANARRVIKDLEAGLAGVQNVEIPAREVLLDAIASLSSSGGSASATHAATRPLIGSVASINQLLVDDLKSLSKLATQAKLARREQERIKASVNAHVNANVFTKSKRL